MSPLRAFHGATGAAGWGDELVLAGVVVITGAFLAWSWWKRRTAG